MFWTYQLAYCNYIGQIYPITDNSDVLLAPQQYACAGMYLWMEAVQDDGAHVTRFLHGKWYIKHLDPDRCQQSLVFHAVNTL